MRIAVAQLNLHIGNFEKNEEKIIAHIKKAETESAEIIIFPELSVCGYPAEDLLNFDSFIQAAERSAEHIAKACTKVAAIVGVPHKNNQEKGKPLYNAAYFLAEGEIKSKHFKSLLPNTDIFDESRYFKSASKVSCIHYQGKKIALTICEDLWENHPQQPPMESLINEKPDIIVNISASPFSFNHIERRSKIFSAKALKYNTPICVVNQVGAHADLIFDGGSAFYSKKGEIFKQLAFFKEDFLTFDSSEKMTQLKKEPLEKYSLIEKALTLGIKDYFGKLNFKKATLGLSGGIDSALVMVLAVKALGAKNVKPLLLPSQFSSEHSVTDAIELCKNLGCDYHIIQITPVYKAFEQQLEDIFKGQSFDVTEENIQSRIRGTLLMAQSNKFGDILLNSSNKSELAVGYGTLYGDMAGGLSVLGDLYKTEVYELSRFLNREKEIIPNHIIEKPPSAELRPNQKDSDSLPDYDVLDNILHAYIELEKDAQEVISTAKSATVANRVIKLVNQSEYKRSQTMPILRVSDKGFGRGRKMPLVAYFP